jgi:hypothetical protein
MMIMIMRAQLVCDKWMFVVQLDAATRMTLCRLMPSPSVARLSSSVLLEIENCVPNIDTRSC